MKKVTDEFAQVAAVAVKAGDSVEFKSWTPRTVASIDSDDVIFEDGSRYASWHLGMMVKAGNARVVKAA